MRCQALHSRRVRQPVQRHGQRGRRLRRVREGFARVADGARASGRKLDPRDRTDRGADDAPAGPRHHDGEQRVLARVARHPDAVVPRRVRSAGRRRRPRRPGAGRRLGVSEAEPCRAEPSRRSALRLSARRVVRPAWDLRGRHRDPRTRPSAAPIPVARQGSPAPAAASSPRDPQGPRACGLGFCARARQRRQKLRGAPRRPRGPGRRCRAGPLPLAGHDPRGTRCSPRRRESDRTAP